MRKILIMLLLLSSCKSKHTTTTVTANDTIIKNSIIKIHPKQLNEIVINEVCDSLGNLIPINYISNAGNVKTSLKSHKNSLKLEINIDSLKQEWIKEYNSSVKISDVERVVIKKFIPKWVLYNLIFSILATLWILRKHLTKLII